MSHSAHSLLPENRLQQAGVHLFYLFGCSIFISKAAINIGYGLLLLTFLIYIVKTDHRTFFRENRYILFLLVPAAVSFLLSFFSLAGLKGGGEFLSRYRFVLLILPFAAFIRDKNLLMRLVIAMNIGALIDMIYSALNSDLSNPFQNIWGFHKFGRHSDMLFTLCLINSTILLLKFKFKQLSEHRTGYALLAVNTLLLFVTVALIGQRGAYVGLFFGLITLFLLHSRRLLILMIVIMLLSPLFAPSYIIQRTRSIFEIGDLSKTVKIEDIKKAKSTLEVGKLSNSVRIRLMKLGVEMIGEKKLYFRGTGAKTIKSAVKEYLDTKSQAVRDHYNDLLTVFPGNFHNSYLQMAIECGVFSLLLYLSVIAFLMFKMLRSLKQAVFDDHIFLSCNLACMTGFAICSFFHEEFFKYGGLVAFLCFYGGCMVNSRLAHAPKGASDG